MVVNPYLVHAYWDVDLSKLPPDTQSAVLRFRQTGRHTFDVHVDLRSRNWYIHLWSPAQTYEADLGIKTSSGQFLPLAHSNRLNTPRAWPVAPNPNLGTDGTFPVSAARAAAPVLRTEDEVQRTEQKTAARPLVSIPAPVSQQQVDAAEVLQKKLAEIYSLRQWTPRLASALASAGQEQKGSSEEAGADAGSVHLTQSAVVPDLTARAEHQFSPGFSSAPPISAIETHRPG